MVLIRAPARNKVLREAHGSYSSASEKQGSARSAWFLFERQRETRFCAKRMVLILPNFPEKRECLLRFF